MKSSKVILISLVILSFAIRFVFLDKFPHGFHKDEASFGYNAYSLLRTGKDEYGRSLPLVFEALGDYKLATEVYSIVPFIAFFGLNDFWVRFSTAFFGALTPLVLFYFSKKIFIRPRICYLIAFSLAISPWHILFSRSVNEATIAVFISLLALYFLRLLIERWSLRRIFLSTFFSIVSLFTYRVQYFFMPFMIFAFSVFFKNKILTFDFKKKFSLVIAALMIFLSLCYLTFFSGGKFRFRDVMLSPTSGEIKLILEEQIREDGRQPPWITRLFHNKIFNLIVTAAKHYVSHFDLSYLFFQGDGKPSINQIPFMGYLLFVDLPFFIFGIFFLIVKRRIYQFFLLPIIWLLTGPIAASFTVDPTSSVRNLVSSIPFAMLIGFGISQVVRLANKGEFREIAIISIVFLYTANLIFFLHQFIIHKTVHKPWFRDVGMNEMLSYVMKVEDRYRKIVFSDYPALYIFILYYGRSDPEVIQGQQKKIQFTDRQREIISLISEKYLLMPDSCPRRGQLEVLYICTKDKVPQWAKIHQVIRLRDGQPAFTILEFNKEFPRNIPPLPPRLSYFESKDRTPLIPTGTDIYW